MAIGSLVVRFGADVSDFNRELSGIARAADKAGAGFQRVGRTLTLGLTAPIVGASVAVAKFAIDFNRGMANVATLIPGNTARVRELGVAVQDMAVRTGKSTADLVDGLYQVISAFGDSADTVRILEINARAATAGLATTLDAINLTSAVTKAFGDTSADAVQHVADLAFTAVRLGQTTFPELAASIGSVTPLAVALGVSVEELFGSFATFTGVTGNANLVATQLASVFKALLRPTGTLKALLRELGFASGQAMVAQLGLKGSLDAIADAAARTGQPLQKFLGRAEGMVLTIAATSGQAETFSKKLAAMTHASGAADEAFRETTDGVNAFGFQLAQLRQELIVAAQRIGQDLIGVLETGLPIVRSVVELIGVLARGFGALPSPIRTTAVVFAGLLAAIGPASFVFGALLKNATLVSALFATLPAKLAAIRAGMVGATAATAGLVTSLRAVALTLGPAAAVAVGITTILALLDRKRQATRDATDAFDAFRSSVASMPASSGLQAMEAELASLRERYAQLQDQADRFARAADAAGGSLERSFTRQAERARAEAQRLGAQIDTLRRDIDALNAPRANGLADNIAAATDAFDDAARSASTLATAQDRATQESVRLADAARASGRAFDGLAAGGVAAFLRIRDEIVGLQSQLRTLEFELALAPGADAAARVADQISEVEARLNRARAALDTFGAGFEQLVEGEERLARIGLAIAGIQFPQLTGPVVRTPTGSTPEAQFPIFGVLDMLMAGLRGTADEFTALRPALSLFHRLALDAGSAIRSFADAAVGVVAGLGARLITMFNPLNIVTSAFDQAVRNASKALGDDFNASIERMVEVLGSALEPVVTALVPVFDALVPIVEKLAPLLSAVAQIFAALFAAIAPIIEAMVPLLRALFPVFKLLAIVTTYVGQVFAKAGQIIFTVAGGIAIAVGAVISAIGKLIDKIPFVSGKPIIAFGDNLKATGRAFLETAQGFGEAFDALGEAREQIKQIKLDDQAKPAATALADVTESATGASAALDGLAISAVRAATGGASVPGAPVVAGAAAPALTINVDATNLLGDPRAAAEQLGEYLVPVIDRIWGRRLHEASLHVGVIA